jgi:hypothetical protein
MNISSFCAEKDETKKTETVKQTKPLPNGPKSIKLGMSLEETKNQLINEPEFGYTGDRDVSLTPGDAQYIIETDATKGLGSIFYTQCWFQFYNEKLYIITMNINTQKMDYYTMFKNFTEKYGEPDEINPEKAVWESDSVTMILEKPLSVKYIDTQVYKNILELSNIEISGEEWTREMFLEEF